MGKIKEGARVVVVEENNEIKRGVVRDVFDELATAIVDLDDGSVEKVSFYRMGIEPETKATEEKPTEPVEKSEVTITPADFMKICSDTIAFEMIKTDPLITLGLVPFCAKLHKALFYDAVDNG